MVVIGDGNRTALCRLVVWLLFAVIWNQKPALVHVHQGEVVPPPRRCGLLRPDDAGATEQPFGSTGYDDDFH